MNIYIKIVVLIMIEMILTTLLCKNKKDNEEDSKLLKLFLYMNFIILFMVAAFRDQTVGRDLRNYLYMMQSLQKHSLHEYLSIYDMEIFFVIVEKVILFFFKQSYALVFTIMTSLAVIGVTYSFINGLSSNKLLSIFLFMTFTFYNQSFNIIRQYISIFLIMTSIVYLSKNQRKAYLVCVLFGSLIHSTAMLGFLLYPIYIIYVKKDRSITNLSILIIIAGIIGLLLSDKLIPLLANVFGYSKYLDRNIDGELGIGVIINILLFLLFFIYRKQYKKFDKNYPIWLVLAAFTVAANLFAIKFSLFGRIVLYGRCAFVVSIPNFISSFKNSGLKKFVNLCCIILFLIYFLNIINGDCYETVPYSSEILNINEKQT